MHRHRCCNDRATPLRTLGSRPRQFSHEIGDQFDTLCTPTTANLQQDLPNRGLEPKPSSSQRLLSCDHAGRPVMALIRIQTSADEPNCSEGCASHRLPVDNILDKNYGCCGCLISIASTHISFDKKMFGLGKPTRGQSVCLLLCSVSSTWVLAKQHFFITNNFH